MPVAEQQGKLPSMQRNDRLLRPAIGMTHQQHAEFDYGHPGQVIFMSDGVQSGNSAIGRVSWCRQRRGISDGASPDEP